MNISLDKKTATDGTLTVSLTESDYQTKVTEKVKEYARKANIKGFRPGKVPVGMVQRLYGKSILVEEINRLVATSVDDYIENEKLNLLGNPLPNEEKVRLIDWDVQRDFEFEFRLGMVEDFLCELSPKIKIKQHTIEVNDVVVNETLADIKKRFGKTSSPDLSQAGDSLFGEIAATGGEEKKSSYLVIGKLRKKEQAKFTGLKKDDTVVFNIEDVADDDQVVAQILNLTAEEAKNSKGSYTFQVSSISRTEPAELNQELFDKVFGPGVVSNESEFLTKIKETISRNYERETNHLLEHHIQHHFVEHVSVNLPDDFLKTWLKTTGTEKVTDDVIEKEFNAYRNSLKWDLIKNKIADDNQIKVDGEEVHAKAKELIAEQFGGVDKVQLAEIMGDRFDAMVNNFLAGQDGKGQQFMRIYNQLRSEKIIAAIKEKITLEEEKVTLEEFKKIASGHRH